MSKKTDQQKELKALLNLIETNSRSLLGEFEKNFIAQQILLQNEQNRLTRKGKSRYVPRIRQLSVRQKKYETFADQIIVLKQAIEISLTPPPKKGVLVQGLVTDDRVMGISKFAGRNIYVSLVNEDKKPIPGISTKRCKTDASGYFSIILTPKDIKLLTKEKIVPKLLVEDGNGKVIKEFVTPPLSKISKIPSTRLITANISFTSNEMVKQKAKRTKEAKLKAAEMRKREEIREREEKRKREEAERLKLVEDTKKKILEEVAKKREAERKKFEKETLERLKAEMEEKMRAKESEIEKETRKKTEAERKKGILKVEKISGIGPKSAEKLKKKGIADVEEFYKTPTGKLGKILGISESRVRDMKEDNVSLLIKATGKREKE